MTFVLLASTGNLIDSFDREAEARAPVDAIVEADPDAAGEVAIIEYDDDGMPVGEAVVGPDPRRASARAGGARRSAVSHDWRTGRRPKVRAVFPFSFPSGD